MKVALGCDHGGVWLKEKIKAFLRTSGAQVVDMGTDSSENVDYPDYAEKVAVEVRDGRADRGILVCRTGIGMCIAANKVSGIRAVAVRDVQIARLSRQHNDANVLCIPGDFIDQMLAQEIVRVWLETAFEGGRHQRRLDKISRLEQRN